MENRWNDADAAGLDGPLAERIYTSRLLGAEPSLVLHGGGNTSVKLTRRDVVGHDVELLLIKGSGHDLATIGEPGFAPIRLERLRELSRLERLSDTDMAREMRAASVDPAAPAPSVEAILHAVLPHRFVDHTHPDALISVMNTPAGPERVEELYGGEAIVLPYVMPGFALARACADAWRERGGDDVRALILMNHGLVTFADDARDSYERTIELVDRAERYLQEHDAWSLDEAPAPGTRLQSVVPALRLALSEAAGRPLIVSRLDDPASFAFARRPDVERIATSGPATPDHVIRTKRVPLVGRHVDAYTSAYAAYFHAHSDERLTMLDPAPRVVVDGDVGVLAVGVSPADARIVSDIYRHTVAMVSRAERLEQWAALPAADVFDVEYWELEQAKLGRGGAAAPFAGEVVAITGAASGIGRACVSEFRSAGAAVVGLDIDPAIERLDDGDPGVCGFTCDVTDTAAVDAALERAVAAFGGLDMLVLNAGIFPPSAAISSLDADDWRRATTVNLDAALWLLQAAYPLLCESPRGGRVVVNASKNVPAPGPKAAAYSASKAALTQLARVAALEWGSDGIRVNVVHPNAVFDTGIWSDDVLASRAASYGFSVDEYRTNNVLRREVRSVDVARGIVALCGDAFARTTGAQVPVDGGNERVI